LLISFNEIYALFPLMWKFSLRPGDEKIHIDGNRLANFFCLKAPKINTLRAIRTSP